MNHSHQIINRRSFLSGCVAVSGSMALSGCLPSKDLFNAEQNWIISAASDFDGNHFAVAVDLAGKLISKTLLPERGHDVIALPDKPAHGIVIARRPDTYLVEVDFENGEIVRQTQSEQGSHFYGHGRLIDGGKYLLTSENHYDTGKGFISVRDSKNLTVLERFESGGIGPHDMAIMPDGKTLVVANGGILTHPDYHRIKLNLTEMEPNLSYLDIHSGKVLASYRPAHHQQSIRHLTVNSDGKVFIGVQYQGAGQDIVPLVYAHKGEEQLQAFKASESQWRSMHQYTATVLVQDNVVSVSCPRGGTLTHWNAKTHEFLERVSMADVSGLCVSKGQLIASSGYGELFFSHPGISNEVYKVSGIRFDNHMSIITVA